MIEEFKQFVTKGNVLTLAVGFIMGVAFAALVTSFVEDVVMPIVAIPFGEPSFDTLALTVNDSTIRYGEFVTAAVGFGLTALAVFAFMVKPYNVWERRQVDEDAAAGPTGPSEIELLTEIRDALAPRER